MDYECVDMNLVGEIVDYHSGENAELRRLYLAQAKLEGVLTLAGDFVYAFEHQTAKPKMSIRAAAKYRALRDALREWEGVK